MVIKVDGTPNELKDLMDLIFMKLREKPKVQKPKVLK